MMPWWAWLVIWGSLGLALIAVLVVSAWLLFRKALGVLDDLGDLAGKAELLDRAEDVMEDQATELAILLGAAETRRRRDLIRTAALERRDARRRGRLDRARSLIRTDASARDWFPSS